MRGCLGKAVIEFVVSQTLWFAVFDQPGSTAAHWGHDCLGPFEDQGGVRQPIACAGLVAQLSASGFDALFNHLFFKDMNMNFIDSAILSFFPPVEP